MYTHNNWQADLLDAGTAYVSHCEAIFDHYFAFFRGKHPTWSHDRLEILAKLHTDRELDQELESDWSDRRDTY